MSTVVVVAAVIAAPGGRVLAAQRAEPAALAGGWEFPGGKVDPGEDERAALVRECREELGVEIAVGERVGGEWPLSPGYVMRVWLCSLASGVPEAKEHLALRWLGPGDYYDVEWLDADLPIMKTVENLLPR
ncbi:(deoxy)nucleoside triphosphate pyrophosphohydrolase [Nonomuraea sp. KC401]|uniref:(deoxy)nucleoside triphosphate pyrophosphohydrolase n=1 Tax=unclassified Nonomuraea TaxID=2593643 RepID=UPI0010FE35E3|nr:MULTISPECIES: (deoxy)nucleoside triphosphate pyrophosphohydrolase [unclassified Nonomuraea]NBE95770.1 NUDIX domain-containing protein [Nonomuraea sp. K271]TLF68128.1 (deoxy)nucleoside triphosphate pyrophosphohydrolase [Nonomuraea sp. KC401]